MAIFGWMGHNNVPPLPSSLIEETEVPFAERMNNLLNKLNVQVRRSGRELPTFVTSKIRSIEDRIREMVQYIGSNKLLRNEEMLLESVVREYIPDSMSFYLSLRPNEQQEQETIDRIVEQFDLIDAKVKEFDQIIRSGNRDKMLTQSFFLDARMK